jgi:hypothetical protein
MQKDPFMGWKNVFSSLFKTSPTYKSGTEIRQTTAGPVKATISVVPLSDTDHQEITKPNSAELNWIAQNLASARKLSEEYGSHHENEALTPETLDEAFSGWLEEWSSTNEDPNSSINAFGIAFGQYLVDTLGLQWAVVTDSHGTEIAVHGYPGDFLVFPPNLVAKRFVKRQTGFMVPLFDSIATDLQRIRNHFKK